MFVTSWQSPEIPKSIRKPWDVFREDVYECFYDEQPEQPLSEEDLALFTAVQTSGAWKTFKSLAVDVQWSYAYVSLSELAAYENWRKVTVPHAPMPEAASTWDEVPVDAKAVFVHGGKAREHLQGESTWNGLLWENEPVSIGEDEIDDCDVVPEFAQPAADESIPEDLEASNDWALQQVEHLQKLRSAVQASDGNNAFGIVLAEEARARAASMSAQECEAMLRSAHQAAIRAAEGTLSAPKLRGRHAPKKSRSTNEQAAKKTGRAKAAAVKKAVNKVAAADEKPCLSFEGLASLCKLVLTEMTGRANAVADAESALQGEDRTWHHDASQIRVSTEAIKLLRTAGEAYMVEVFAQCNLLANHAKRVTVLPKDHALVKHLMTNYRASR